MNIYVLKPKDRKDGGGPWNPWYDKAFGFIVAASGPHQARILAASRCGDEGMDVWFDPKWTTCKILKASKQGIILRDYAAA